MVKCVLGFISFSTHYIKQSCFFSKHSHCRFMNYKSQNALCASFWQTHSFSFVNPYGGLIVLQMYPCPTNGTDTYSRALPFPPPSLMAWHGLPPAHNSSWHQTFPARCCAGTTFLLVPPPKRRTSSKNETVIPRHACLVPVLYITFISPTRINKTTIIILRTFNFQGMTTSYRRPSQQPATLLYRSVPSKLSVS